jgi:dihydrofolate reductase
VAAEIRHAALKAMTMGKPVVMGRKTFESIAQAAARAHQHRRHARREFSRRGAVVTTSFADARAVARGDALRRFATEIAVIGGAEIYAQWMDVCRPAGDHRGACPARGRHALSRPSTGVWEEVARVRIRRSGRQRRLLLCDISSAKAALTALTAANVLH